MGSSPTSATVSSSSSSATSTTAAATTTSSTGSTEVSTTSTTACGQCCGDGEIELPDEECDDGNVMGGDGCSSDCRKEFRLVFVTNETFAADFGGSQGADDKCQNAATMVGLPGVFRAWLSTSLQEPLDDGVSVQSAVPYRRLDGLQVALNWPDLLDGTLDNPINLTETMQFVPGPVCDARAVWTASFANGVNYGADEKSCADWTSTSGTTTGGNPSETTSSWSQGCPLMCGAQASLYCFEQ